jgi:rare lipoprotein A
MWKKFFLFSLILLAVLAGNFVFANEEEVILNEFYHINLDQPTIAKGYTVSAFNDAIKLSLVPGILDEATGVDMIKLNEIIDMPWKLEKLSDIYQFEFQNKEAYDNHQPFYIQFSYEQESNYLKQVYFFDKNYATWRPLPTRDYPDEKFVRSLIHLPFARIAIFANPDALAIGKASWYGYKGGNFAASPDFPKGSIVRVFNTDNDKFVDVEINDFGPERKLHPDRVIDLDKVAFSRIAALSAGIINVRIEPIETVAENNRVLGIPETGAELNLNIESASAVLFDESSGDVLWQKEATSTLPIASLTKLVAIKVFLDLRPTLNREVAYSIKDEEYNYEYCNKWESARVALNDGDTLTVEDLVYSALVGSANNAVESLVRVSGLTREEFINQMNLSARNWGALSTNFIEPTGLSPENVSSSLDYAIITREMFKHPIIQKASTMGSYIFYTINTEKKHTIRNTNALIHTSNLNITGSKTGYLDEAGYCLMLRAAEENRKVIVVVLNADSRDNSFMEAEDLVKFGLRELRK